MALSKFNKTNNNSAISGENNIDLDTWHSPTGGFTATDAKLNLQSLKGVRRENFQLTDDASLAVKKKAKEEFKKQSKNGRNTLKIDEEIAKEIVTNNTQLINTAKAVAKAEVSNQKLKGVLNISLQSNRVELARIKASGQDSIRQADSQVNAIFLASKATVKDIIS